MRAKLTDHFRLLWPGDIEAVAEKHIIEQDIGAVDVMLMPHHGSSTSSLAEFVSPLQPSLVIAQTGFGNHYGFPRADVVSRYKALGASIRNTANGAVLLHWPQAGKPPDVRQWQEESGSRRVMVLDWMSSEWAQ